MDKKDIFKKIIIESQGMEMQIVKRDMALPAGGEKVVALYGPRRCGKTYLFYQTMKELRERGISAKKMLYVNFEDERILPFHKEDFELLLDAFFELYPENASEKIYVFLDEVQEIELWEKFVRRLTEKGKSRVCVTGSSSKLFSKEIATALRGRTISRFLMPLSFGEFLRAKKIDTGAHFEHTAVRHKIKQLLGEYMAFGGFPEIVNMEEHFKIEILQGYFELIFHKDIVERHGIRNMSLMKDLMRYLLTNFSSLFSLTGYFHFLKSCGHNIGKDTLFEYLFLLEEAQFVRLVPLFDYSLKKQMINPRKAYCIDNGLITAVTSQFADNKGRYLENLVFLELLRRGKEIYYYRDGAQKEIDFLIADKGKPAQLIQVCVSLDHPQVMKREIESIVSAARAFNVKECVIITEDRKDEFKERNLKIKAVPVWQWLLTP